MVEESRLNLQSVAITPEFQRQMKEREAWIHVFSSPENPRRTIPNVEVGLTPIKSTVWLVDVTTNRSLNTGKHDDRTGFTLLFRVRVDATGNVLGLEADPNFPGLEIRSTHPLTKTSDQLYVARYQPTVVNPQIATRQSKSVETVAAKPGQQEFDMKLPIAVTTKPPKDIDLMKTLEMYLFGQKQVEGQMIDLTAADISQNPLVPLKK